LYDFVRKDTKKNAHMQEKCTFLEKNMHELLQLSEKSCNFAAQFETSTF